MQAQLKLKWRHLSYWVVGAIVAAAVVIVAFDQPDIECSQARWDTVDGVCMVEFTLSNRTRATSAVVVAIRAYNAKSFGKGARGDYLVANRHMEVELLPMERRIMRERLDVHTGALRTVEVEARGK